MEMQKDDILMYWGVKSGYYHFYWHPDIRYYFLFRYRGRYYRFIAPRFGWETSEWGFIKLLLHLVQHIRGKMGYRLLTNMDDFLIASRPLGRVAGEEVLRGPGSYWNG